MKLKRRSYYLATCSVFMFETLLCSVSCVKTGPGGEKSLILIPTATEVAIGKEIAADIESKEKVVKDPGIASYVREIGQKVASRSDRSNLQYSFKVIEKDDVNAFALPGGYIYVYTGLLKFLDNEAQLAAVLGHEVGHVVGRHAVKRLQAVYGYQLVAEIALGGRMSPLAHKAMDASVGLILQGYGRSQEHEADQCGVLYGFRAGYNPRAMVQVLEKIKGLEKRPPTILERYLVSHPPTSERMKKCNEEIRKLKGTEDLPFFKDEYAAFKTKL